MLNKAILMGRLVADPELRRTPNNNSVTSFTLAVNRSFTRQGEQPQTDFIDIVAWGKTAEFVSRYFVKGQQVAVAGRIQTRMWEDKQGNKRKSVEVVAEEVHFAEPKRDNSQPRNEMPQQGGFDPMAGLGGNAFAALPGDDNDLPF
ncbi:MAG: single-stranded DNA-binding protein [Clostridia bacterium]|jgi:single-strand DNA-binding protein|nr:single-stranded DNA-binding protein [Clostridia bacterium]